MEPIILNGASQTFAPIPAGPATLDLGLAATGNVAASGNVSASDIIKLTGTLAGNTVLLVAIPQAVQVVGTDALAGAVATGWIKLFHNAATLAGHTLSVGAVDSSGTLGAVVVVPAASRQWLYSPDGLNVYPAAPSV